MVHSPVVVVALVVLALPLGAPYVYTAPAAAAPSSARLATHTQRVRHLECAAAGRTISEPPPLSQAPSVPSSSAPLTGGGGSQRVGGFDARSFGAVSSTGRITPLSVPPPSVADMVNGEDVEALYEQAKLLLQTRRRSEAIVLYERLTRLAPEDGRVWIKLMTTHKSARNLEAAEAAVRRGIEACPENARLRQALADMCREQKRHEEAREHFRIAMRLEPSLASVYDSWGRMEAALGQEALAASLYERGLQVQPTARLCHAYGVLLDTRGDAERAREALRRGLRLPNEASNPQLLHALGMVEVRAGHHAAARSHFLTAIKENPTFTMAHLSLGQLEERLGNQAAARRYYSAGAVAKQPAGRSGGVQLWQSWARMEQRIGNPREALRLYERASERFPNDHQLLVEWAKLAGEHGDARVARRLFERATAGGRGQKGGKPQRSVWGGGRAMQPTPYSFQCAAAFEAKGNRTERARGYFERGAALAVAPGSKAAEERMPLLHAWAVFEGRLGEVARARSLFQEAEEAAPEGGCGWLLQWRARFEAEQHATLRARHFYGRSVTLSPEDSSAWRMWAEMEAAIGETERAEVLQRHAQYVETMALLSSGGVGTGSTRRGTKKSPLSPSDMYG